MRRCLCLVTFVLSSLLLTGCQKGYDAYVGTWYELNNYDTFDIAQTGDTLVMTYKGSPFAIDTSHDVPSVTLSLLGTFTLLLDQDHSLLRMATGSFTRDQALASSSYDNAARTYARNLLAQIYKLEMGSLIDFSSGGNNCLRSKDFGLSKGFMDATASPSILGCTYTWDRDNRAATFDMQLPFGKTLNFRSQDLFGADDTTPIAGQWRFHLSVGDVLLEVFDGTAGKDGLLGTLDYSRQYDCHANLRLLRRDGYSFRTEVYGQTGSRCPAFQSATWISAMGQEGKRDQYAYIDADFPTPTPAQFGVSMSGNHLGKAYGYVGPASERPIAADEPAKELASTAAVPEEADTTAAPQGAPSSSAKVPVVIEGEKSTLTLVRPLADPVASGVPRLYNTATTMNGGDGKACASIDPGNPTKYCKVSVSSSGQYAWGSSWCAASAAALNNYLNHATLRYELDGQPIAVSQFWEGQSSTCLKRRLIVQNIRGGERHELKLTITLDQDLLDGGSRYPAGEYELTLEVEAALVKV